MDILVGFLLLFLLLLVSSLKGLFAGYALIIGLFFFIWVGRRHGYPLAKLIQMSLRGGLKSLIVLQIFFLIGIIISVWMAAGTIPAIVFYGIKLIHPQLFLLTSFLATCLVSILIGTSIGTASTIGMAMMIMARSGHVYLPLAAGAIMSGAYFGDRNSPMSSSANLVAQITGTNLYDNIRGMICTSILPFTLTVIIYGLLSFLFPISNVSSMVSQGIIQSFQVSPWVLLPAFSILVLSGFKVNVKKSMLISIAIASALCIGIQNIPLSSLLHIMIFGFKLPPSHPMSSVLQGGGILSMMKIGLIVFLSSAFTGIFEGTSLLDGIIKRLAKKKNRWEIFGQTLLLSIASSIIGCTQALAVMLTNLLAKDTYQRNHLTKEELAIDLENSAITLAPMIPWNIAALVPLSIMDAKPISLIFSFYLYLLPLTYWLSMVRKTRREVEVHKKITETSR